MKKKNVIGHMAAEQESRLSRFHKLHLVSRLVSLLLAVLLWLIVVNVAESGEKELPNEPNLPFTEYAEE